MAGELIGREAEVRRLAAALEEIYRDDASLADHLGSSAAGIATLVPEVRDRLGAPELAVDGGEGNRGRWKRSACGRLRGCSG